MGRPKEHFRGRLRKKNQTESNALHRDKRAQHLTCQNKKKILARYLLFLSDSHPQFTSIIGIPFQTVCSALPDAISIA
jgi:hypothetical protein